jgi:DNA-binding transcriptional LysR family regulator
MSYVERMVALAEGANLAQVNGRVQTGRIEIGASRPVSSACCRRYRWRSKRFQRSVIHVENSHWIFEQVLAFRLDLGIIGIKPRHPDLIVSPFFDEALVLVVSPTHPWAKRKSFKLKELTGQSLVMREKGSGTRELIEAALNKSDAKPIIAMEIGSNEAIKRAVEGNIGLAFYPPSVIDAEVKQGEMKALKISDVRLELSFNVVYHQEKRSSPVIRAFMEVLNEQRPKPAPY